MRTVTAVGFDMVLTQPSVYSLFVVGLRPYATDSIRHLVHMRVWDSTICPLSPD